MRNDMLGRQRGDISARCREPINHNDHRFLALQLAQGIIKLFRTGRGAARTVDVDDHRARARTPKPAERFDAILIAADQALDLDARNICARRHQTGCQARA